MNPIGLMRGALWDKALPYEGYKGDYSIQGKWGHHLC
jgi:hypothetical protein